jgi:CBS domain-containing protein
MKVRDVMTKQSVSCQLDTTLGAAATLMLENNLGFLPVVGDGGNVIGALTDRDICFALGLENEKAGEIAVRDLILPMNRTVPKLFACTPDDKIHCVLKMMSEAKIRRLPVVNREGELQGVLSIDDLVVRACENPCKEGISCREVVEAYKIICRPTRRHPAAA